MTSYFPESTTNLTVQKNLVEQPGFPSIYFIRITGIQNNAAVTSATLDWTLDRPFFLKSIDGNHKISGPLTCALYTQVRVTVYPPNGSSYDVYFEQQMEGVVSLNGAVPAMQPVQLTNWKKVYPGYVLDAGTRILITFVVMPQNTQNADPADRTSIVISGYYIGGSDVQL